MALAVVGLVVLAGCGGEEDSRVELIEFRAPAGTQPTEILQAGELTIEAGCVDAAGPVLSVAASTMAADATIASVYRQKRSAASEHKFVLDEFGRDYGPWDFLGGGNERVTGTLEYSSPGEHVSVSFFADQDHGDVDCLLSGTAVVAGR